MPTRPLRPRTLLLLAALLAGLSLGLPWGTGGAGQPGAWVGGYYAPGYCVTVYDYDGYASLDCSTGTYNSGIYFSGDENGVRSGYAHPARVFVVGAAVLVGVGLRQRSARLLRIALAVAAVGVLCDGVGSGSGFFVALAAVAVLATALHRMHVISFPSGRSMYRRGPQARTI
jgi:hypothetical protein